jgi:hypothetical protein
MEDAAIEVMASLAKYVFSLIGREALWMMRYSESPPGFFPGLLDPKAKEGTLSKMQEYWEALVELEKQSLDDPALLADLQSLVWPNAPWVRDMFIGASEVDDFKDIPSDCEEEVDGYATAQKTTKRAEDGFNVCRDELRHNKSGVMGREHRLHALMSSGLAAECERGGAFGDSTDARGVGKANRANIKYSLFLVLFKRHVP